LTTSARSSTYIYVTLIVLIIVAGVVGYYAGHSAAPGNITTTTTTTTTFTTTFTTTTTTTTTFTASQTQAPTTSSTVQLPSQLTFVEIGKGVDPYWSIVQAGMQKAAQEIQQKYGIKINAIFWVPTKEDAALQLQGIDSYLAQNINGLALAPIDPVSATPIIQKAISQGIPTITIDTDANGSARVAYLGTGNYRAGYLAGTAAYVLAKEKGYITPGATVNVGIITGSLSAENSIDRIKGFEQALTDNAKADPDINGNITFKFIGPYEDKGAASSAVNYALSILQQYPNLQIAFGVYVYEGPAWEQAFKQLGYKPGQVVTVEFDVTSNTVPPIQDGYAQVTVGQREYFMGYYGLWLLFNMTLAKLQGGTWDDALKQFIPNYPENQVYDTGVDLIGATHMEFNAPNGQKVVILSLQEYKQLATNLGIPPDLLGLQNVG